MQHQNVYTGVNCPRVLNNPLHSRRLAQSHFQIHLQKLPVPLDFKYAITSMMRKLHMRNLYSISDWWYVYFQRCWYYITYLCLPGQIQAVCTLQLLHCGSSWHHRCRRWIPTDCWCRFPPSLVVCSPLLLTGHHHLYKSAVQLVLQGWNKKKHCRLDILYTTML